MQVRQYVFRAFVVAGVACAMLWPAFWNGGAFYTEDTRTYIRSGDAAIYKLTHRATAWTATEDSAPAGTGEQGNAEQQSFLALHNQAESRTRSLAEISKKGVLLGRSPFYGLLLYLGAITGGFWVSMLLQAGDVLLALYLALRAFQIPVWPYFAYVGVALCIVPATPFYASFLIPDIYAGISILACAVLFSARSRIPLRDLLLWYLLLAASVLFHDSCIMIVAALLLAAVVVNLIRRNLRPRNRVSPNTPALVLLLLVLVTAYMGQALVIFGLKRVTGETPLRLPFLSARLIADGPGTVYLHATCPASHFTLCEDVGEFPITDSEFLFSVQPGRSVFEVAPYEKRKAISDEQVRFFFSVLRYDPGAVIKTDARAAFLQLFDFTLDAFHYGPDERANLDHTIPLRVLAGIQASRAYNDTLPLMPLSVFLYVLVAGSVAYVCIIVWNARGGTPVSTELRQFYLWIVAGIALNAAVCADISGVFPRLQCRVVWLVPLAALLIYFSRKTAFPPLRQKEIARMGHGDSFGS
jgi:hypothetical protein